MKTWKRTAAVAAGGLLAATALVSSAYAFGEAGPLNLAEFGAFYVNTTPIMNEDGTVSVTNQMFVEYMVPENQTHPYPVILVPGGGGHGYDWMQTVDQRDGWVQWLVSQGFAVYWIDRPGAGRSASNTTYVDRDGNPGQLGAPFSPTPLITRLAFSDDWPNAPMVYDADGNPDRMAWGAANGDNPTLLAWAAGSPTTPNASVEVQTQAQVALLEMIGPAIIFTHSAGGTTAGAAAARAAVDDLVVGVLSFESGGANAYGNSLLTNSTWTGEAPAEAARANRQVEGADCSLQSASTPVTNETLADVRFAYLGSQYNSSVAQAACIAEQYREAGIEAIGVFMPENGHEGTGHFAMSELSSGEIATDILVPMLEWLGKETDDSGLVTH